MNLLDPYLLLKKYDSDPFCHKEKIARREGSRFIVFKLIDSDPGGLKTIDLVDPDSDFSDS